MKTRKRQMIATCIISILALTILPGCQKPFGQNNHSDVQTQMQQSINTDTQRTAITEEQLKGKLNNPDLYNEDYINEITKTVNSVNEKTKEESLGYIFITDMHFGATEPTDDGVFRQLNAAVDVANNSDVDFLCIGGDSTDGRFAAAQGGKQRALDYWTQIRSVLKKCNKPVFILKGNHDDNSFSAQKDDAAWYDPNFVISNDEWYQATMAEFNQYTTEYHNGYYYYDLPGKNTRVVCLNMSDTDDTVVDGNRAEVGINDYGYSNEQIKWLLDQAMSRQECQYVFLSHDGFEGLAGYDASSNLETLKDIIVAADSKTSFQSDKLSKDFTNWTGKIDLYHYGHLHHERTILDLSVNGIPMFTTDSPRIYDYSNSGFGNRMLAAGFSKVGNRLPGTISEAVFDVVIQNQDQFDFIRFGDGDDWKLNK